jgi:hypothetical protein
MATAAEATLWLACNAAAGVKQVAYTSAFATYQAAGFTPAARATYVAAILAADVAQVTAINTACNTAGISPSVVPDEQGSLGPSILATIAS